MRPLPVVFSSSIQIASASDVLWSTITKSNTIVQGPVRMPDALDVQAPSCSTRANQMESWPGLYHTVVPRRLANQVLRVSAYQGSPYRWESVRFDRLPVKPIRSGSGLGRYQIGSNSKFKFEFKKNKKIPKKFLKILQGVTNVMVSNFLKNSFV